MKYIRVVRTSELTSVPDDLQSAFVGMIFPTVDMEDPSVRDFMEQVAEEVGEIHFGYFVRAEDVVGQLIEREFNSLAFMVRDSGLPYIWFSPDACEEIDRSRFN